MENINNDKGIQNGSNEPKKEELDTEFLEEMNRLTKQLKTDEEILNDLKLKEQPSNNAENKKEKTKEKNGELKLNNNTNTNIINENPFKEAYELMTGRDKENFFNPENNDLICESLNSFNEQVSQFNSILNNVVNLKNKNGLGDSEKMEQEELNMMGNILDFLIQSNLLKDTILNMKKNIEKSLEKNRKSLKNDEIEKYQSALGGADAILGEVSKLNPDKEKIMDSLQKLQQISNDIDSILFI